MLRIRITTVILVASILLPVLASAADDPEPLKPGPEEKCQVCGMFVAKFPAWVTQVSFNDGETAFFDGPKDMFKYLFNLKKYMPGKTRKDVKTITVTGYYDLKPLRAEGAHFVDGSDVVGPMGNELVPFASQAEAKEFCQDHKGNRILRLEEITPEIIAGLD